MDKFRNRISRLVVATNIREQTVMFLRILTVVVLCGSFAYSVVTTISWAMMIDSPIMHYVVFLMQHGLKPFSEITDNNMPGAYLTEAWAMKLFGTTDLAWRVYEFTLLLCLMVSASIIARKYDWVAGVFASGVFMLMHLSEGPWVAVEREEVLTVLLFISFAALFSSIRKRTPWLAFLFGLAGALAGSIKPTFLPLPFVVLALAVIHLRRSHERTLHYVLWGSSGIVIVLLLNLDFLLHYGVLGSFLFLVKNVLPNYASLPYLPLSTKQLIQLAAPVRLVALAIAASVVFVINRGFNWEKASLAVAASCGLLSFFIQHKGFQHHRYTFLAFLLLLVALELFRGLRTCSLSYAVSLVAIVFTLTYIIPSYLRSLQRLPTSSSLTAALESDIQRIGSPTQLQRNVECFDLVFGCINALYHLQIVGNSGFTGDLLFFSHTNTAASNYYRQMFWRTAAKHPAEIIVVSNEWFGHANSFEKLNAWPEFYSYLNSNYELTISRSFPLELISGGKSPYDSLSAPAYRIYLRRAGKPQGTIR